MTPKADIMLEIRLNEVETDAESRIAYDDVYDSADITQSESFYLWIYEKLGLRADDRYLDVSCGRGQLPALASRQNIFANGLDLSHTALVQGRENAGNSHLVAANAQQLPYADGSFTAISNIGSIEHYTDMPLAVREMARVLQPNGKALILLPNTFSLLVNIWIALRHGRTSIDPYQPIQRYAAREEWAKLLTENGFRIEQTFKYDQVRPRTQADWISYLRHPRKLVRFLVAPFVPANLTFCFVFLCRKT